MYQTTAAELRAESDTLVKVMGGFATLELVLAAWFAEHPPGSCWVAWVTFVFNFALGGVAVMLVARNYGRRTDLFQTRDNIETAWGMKDEDVFLPGRAVSPAREARSWKSLYIAAIFFICLAQSVPLILPLHGVTGEPPVTGDAPSQPLRDR